jgi:AraC family transcriptional regulator
MSFESLRACRISLSQTTTDPPIAMNDVLVETVSGQISAGLRQSLISSSLDKPWNGFYVKEHGATDFETHEVILLKHIVCLQFDAPAKLSWNGEGKFVSKTIQPGRISVYPANQLHSGSYKHEGKHVAVLIDPEFLAAALDNGTKPDGLRLRWEHGIDSPPLRELVLLLLAEATRSPSDNGHYATAIARLLCIHLVQHHAIVRKESIKRGGLSPTRLRRVLEYIDERVGEEMTLDALAHVAGLSVFHFSRVFRQSTGQSPFQYVTEARVRHAKKLLLQPFARIGDIALDCGFCDQAHLNRHFKRLVGMTPAAYVRSLGHRNNPR